MQSRNREFEFGIGFNFATDSLITYKENLNAGSFPHTDFFMLLDTTHFLLLDGTNFLLLGS